VTVVGVAGDTRQYGLDREPADEIYVPLAQYTALGVSLLVRTAADPLAMAERLREAVYDVDPEQPMYDVQTLEQVRADSLSSPRLTTLLLGLFAALALVITLTGLSGVMALAVNQRRHEIGLRMALGATPWNVLRLVMRQGMLLVAAGVALGVVGAVALADLISGLLFGVEPTDAVTYLAVSLVFIGVAATACFMPARRATAIDPMMALRSD
jgi:ABC-type antimicrobial peptide transport system permease subunit